MRRFPTSPLPAATLIAAYAVAVLSGSRPLGGLVLVAGGLGCAWLWRSRHGARTALMLTAAGFAAFVCSHGLALLIGAWPAVLSVAALIALATWVHADARDDAGPAIAAPRSA